MFEKAEWYYQGSYYDKSQLLTYFSNIFQVIIKCCDFHMTHSSKVSVLDNYTVNWSQLFVSKV